MTPAALQRGNQMQESAASPTLLAAFHDRMAAERAVADLEAAGFGHDDVGFLSHQPQPETVVETGGVETSHSAGMLAGASRGSLTGGAVGGILGALAALLIPGIGPIIAGGMLAGIVGGAVAGGAVGGLGGALRGLDVPAEQATYYEGEVGRGRSLVTVRPGNRRSEAVEILRRNGGYDQTTGEAAAPAPAPAGYAQTTDAAAAGSGAGVDSTTAENERLRQENERLRLEQERRTI